MQIPHSTPLLSIFFYTAVHQRRIFIIKGQLSTHTAEINFFFIIYSETQCHRDNDNDNVIFVLYHIL